MHKPQKSALMMAVALSAVLWSHPVTAAPGDRVAAFNLTDLTGKQHTYSEYEGQILLLFFLGHN